jgi:hypothetical protein
MGIFTSILAYFEKKKNSLFEQTFRNILFENTKSVFKKYLVFWFYRILLPIKKRMNGLQF